MVTALRPAFINHRLTRVNPLLVDGSAGIVKNQPMVDIARETFATRFEKLRGGMSYQALSDAIYRKTRQRVSAQAMHKWTRGGGIGPDKLKLLAEFFDVSEVWLMYGDPKVSSLDEAVGALPDASRQEVFDFIEYKFARAENMIAGDSAGEYLAMIDRIRRDMKERLRKNPDPKPKEK